MDYELDLAFLLQALGDSDQVGDRDCSLHFNAIEIEHSLVGDHEVAALRYAILVVLLNLA